MFFQRLSVDEKKGKEFTEETHICENRMQITDTVRKERTARMRNKLQTHLFDFKSIPFLRIRHLSMTPTPAVPFSLSPPTGESINPRVAGLIGRSGPQNKQPFMVAFFKATEVHLRSIRSAPGGAKQRNPNRSKGAKSQEALRVANVAGNTQRVCVGCTVSADLFMF